MEAGCSFVNTYRFHASDALKSRVLGL